MVAISRSVAGLSRFAEDDEDVWRTTTGGCSSTVHLLVMEPKRGGGSEDLYEDEATVVVPEEVLGTSRALSMLLCRNKNNILHKIISDFSKLLGN